MKCLLLVAILGSLAACALCDDAPTKGGKCEGLQKVKMQRQWAKAYGEGKQRIQFGARVWMGFFKEYPKFREIFKDFRSDNVYHPKFQAFSQREFTLITMCIESTDDPEALKAMIDTGKEEDADKGFVAEFYGPFKEHLMAVLPRYLGNHFDWDSWDACLNRLVDALKA